MLKKYEFIVQNRGRKSDFLKKYEIAENLLDSQQEIFAISNSSKEIQASLDIKQLRKRRRENFYNCS
ncbi:hypothetical protein [Eubacterium aggregans]|uniref:hypothetical protein n=1 Tax=Eubacterium aggregans TaxID=81409 RepID=UPI003F312610